MIDDPLAVLTVLDLAFAATVFSVATAGLLLADEILRLLP